MEHYLLPVHPLNQQEINFTGHVTMVQALLPALRESALRSKTRQGSSGASVPGPAIVMVRAEWYCKHDVGEMECRKRAMRTLGFGDASHLVATDCGSP